MRMTAALGIDLYLDYGKNLLESILEMFTFKCKMIFISACSGLEDTRLFSKKVVKTGNLLGVVCKIGELIYLPETKEK